MRGRNGVCAYGSGLLSSYGELQHAIESDEVQRYPLQLEWAINQVAEIDHYQPLLFIVESFDHLFDEAGRLERWMREGKLNNVGPGLPVINESDLRSFLDAGAASATASKPGSSDARRIFRGIDRAVFLMQWLGDAWPCAGSLRDFYSCWSRPCMPSRSRRRRRPHD